VNANRRYFQSGLRHLGRFRRDWKESLEALVTSRQPLAEFHDPLMGKETGTIKTVLTLAN
jgi:hypothetical protein